jgi:hypothetical protein
MVLNYYWVTKALADAVVVTAVIVIVATFIVAIVV